MLPDQKKVLVSNYVCNSFNPYYHHHLQNMTTVVCCHDSIIKSPRPNHPSIELSDIQGLTIFWMNRGWIAYKHLGYFHRSIRAPSRLPAENWRTWYTQYSVAIWYTTTCNGHLYLESSVSIVKHGTILGAS